MKKTFLAKRNALLSPGDFSVGALSLAFVGALLLMRLLFPNLFWSAVAPLMRVATNVADTVHRVQAGFADTSMLVLERDRIVQEHAALVRENQALQDENAAIRSLVGDSSSHRRAAGILAGVLARPPESPYDTLILSSGKNQGVTLRMEAFGPGGVPLGMVTSVLDDFSRVTLFSAPGESFLAWISSAHIPVTVTGAGAGALNASVSRTAGVHEGDIVFGPGPGALPIGTIARIDDVPSAPTLALRIVPVENLFSLTWVELRDVGGALRGTLGSATSTLP